MAEAYRRLIPDGVLDGLSVADRSRAWAEILTCGRPAGRTVVAHVGGVVIGFASVGPCRAAVPALPAVDGELYALYLAPSSWGCGAGRWLHAAAVRELRSWGVGRASLWVLDGNERAVRFYRRAGWAGTGWTRCERGPGGVSLAEGQMVLSL